MAMNEDQAERTGTVLANVIYWVIVVVVAALAAFATAAAGNHKGMFGVPSIAWIGLALILWVGAAVLAWRAYKQYANARQGVDL